MVRLLCENGANIHDRNFLLSTPLIEAVEGGHNDSVEYLCLQGSDVNARGSYDTSYAEYYRKTPLLIACNEGYVDTIKILFTHGANHFDRVFVSEFFIGQGRNDVEKTCVTIANHQYRPYIKQIINRWSTTMFIIVLQELLVYHHLDTRDIIYFFFFIGDDY
jgi:ankyrin repeat protein